MKLFTSERFWGLFVVLVLQILKIFNVIDGVTADAVAGSVQIFITGIVAIRTLDRTADKKSLRD